MKRKGTLWSCDSFRHFAWLPSHDRVVLPDVPHFFCLFLAFLLLSFLLSHRLHPALLKRLNELGNFQTLPLRWNKAAFGRRRLVERMYPVFVVSFKVHAFIVGVDICVRPSSLAQTTYQRDIGLAELHMFVVELV